MTQTFAQLVEGVKQLSHAEREELLELLDRLLIEGTEHKARDEKARGKKLDLAELVSRMPADNQATEERFGEPVGKEEW